MAVQAAPGCLNCLTRSVLSWSLEHVGVAALLAVIDAEGVAGEDALQARVLLEPLESASLPPCRVRACRRCAGSCRTAAGSSCPTRPGRSCPRSARTTRKTVSCASCLRSLMFINRASTPAVAAAVTRIVAQVEPAGRGHAAERAVVSVHRSWDLSSRLARRAVADRGVAADAARHRVRRVGPCP